MTESHSSDEYRQMAREARQLASGHQSPIEAIHLREKAVFYERQARKLERIETHMMKPRDTGRGLRAFFGRGKG